MVPNCNELTESHLDEQINFPIRPTKDKDNNWLIKSLMSLILFIGAFYLFFNKGLKFVLILVLVIFIHELGHFFAMKFFKYKDVKMFFIPLLGALVTGEKEKISQKQRSIILLAGPVPGICIGLILYALGLSTGNYDLTVIANIFIFLNVFNLLPVVPLDGGNLFNVLFIKKKEVFQYVFLILSIIGFLAIVYYTKSYFPLIIPLFLLMRLIASIKMKKVKASLDIANIDYNKPFDKLSDKEYWLIRDQIVSEFKFRDAKPKVYEVSRQEKQIGNTMKSLSFEEPVQDLSSIGKAIFFLIWLVFLIGPILLRIV